MFDHKFQPLQHSLMAETQSKRQREETQVVVQQEEHVHDEEKVKTKRRKPSSSSSSSYNEILSLLDEEEDMPNQDVSSLITTLQEELSSDSNNNVDLDPLACTSAATEPEGEPPLGSGEDCSSALSSFPEEEEEGERERVMRHLLEASDDELGLPSVDNGVEEGVFNGGEVMNFGDNLWELEDETANYYTLLQSEIFSCEWPNSKS